MDEKIQEKLQDISLDVEDEVRRLSYDEAAQEIHFSLIAKPINPQRQSYLAMILLSHGGAGGE